MCFLFQSEMKMNIEFTEDLNNATSQEFLKLAHKVENALFPPVNEALPAVTAICCAVLHYNR